MIYHRNTGILVLLLVLFPVLMTAQEDSPDIMDECRMAAYLRQAKESVVSIQTFSASSNGRQSRIGSGFVYTKDGFIVTRKSVIEEGDSIQVSFYDGSMSPAWVVYYDPMVQLGLLKLSRPNLRPVRLGEAGKMHRREQLVILGNSMGVFPSVTLAHYSESTQPGIFRLDAMVPPGNSGSPVLNQSGEVVGVVAGQVYPAPGDGNESGPSRYSVALSSEMVRRVMDSVIRDLRKRDGWVGISVISLDGLSPDGVRVVGMAPGGPVHQAGIVTGDTLVAFEGKPIESTRQLSQWVKSLPPESEVRFTLKRNGAILEKTVRIEATPWVAEP